MDIRREISRIAKMLLSFNYVQKDEYTVIPSSNYWPKIVVIQASSDNYRVIKFNSKRKVASIVDKMGSSITDADEYIRFWVDVFDSDDVTKSFEGYKHRGEPNIKEVKEMVMTFLEKFALFVNAYTPSLLLQFSPGVREILFDTDTTMNKQELFRFFTKKNKYNHEFFSLIFGEFDMSSSDTMQDTFDYEKWQIFVEEGVKLDKKELINLLSNVEKALSSRGLMKLAYGKIIAVNTLKGLGIADYFEKTDSIRIRTKFKSNRDNVSFMLHELGHRMLSKFMKRSQLDAINRVYIDKKNNVPSVTELDIQDGDELESESNGEVYVVEDPTRLIVRLEAVSDKRRKKSVGKLFQFKKEALVSFKLNGKKIEPSGEATFFPTPYAYNSAQEMYCEMFAYWLLGQLKSPAKDFMDQLHK